MMRRFLVIAASAVALFIVAAARPAPAMAAFKLCNTSGEKVSVAIAYHDKESDNWVSRGWWNIADGECKTPLPGDLKNKYYYIYGDGEKNTWTGSHTFCVDNKNAFTLNQADTTSDYDYEKFFEVDTGDASGYTYTFK
jgi:uncharacterized membrane protein